MKKYWPLLFIALLILFQTYVSTWNKTQTTTFAKREGGTSPIPTKYFHPSQAIINCLVSFNYPSTTIENTQRDNLFMETSDKPFQVIEWYKQRFKNENYSLVSDIINTVNGTSSNMLVGEKRSQQISITIGRGAQEADTNIFIHATCN